METGTPLSTLYGWRDVGLGGVHLRMYREPMGGYRGYLVFREDWETFWEDVDG